MNTKKELFTMWWSDKTDKDNVFDLYPRPNLVRKSFINLNGQWDYIITKNDFMPKTYTGKILVPFPVESNLSGVKYKLMPDDILWYRRFFNIPLDNKKLILHFGAVDQVCDIYVNKVQVKTHQGGYLPFSVDITEYVLENKINELVVKVSDFTDTSYYSRGLQSLKDKKGWHSSYSGIWQTVWMELVPYKYIKNVKTKTNFDRKSLTCYILGVESGTYEIYDGIELIGEGEFKNGQFDFTFPNEFKAWSPEHPFLYKVIIDTEYDRVATYFAMRKISYKKDRNGIPRLCLNNSFYRHIGILDCGYWPDGLCTPPSEQAMVQDIKFAKECGFNMIRKHGKVEPLRWYYYCDKVGILVWQDIVNGGGKYKTKRINFKSSVKCELSDSDYKLFSREKSLSRENYLNELTKTMNCLNHFPSIVTWVLFNNGWGQFDAKSIAEKVKKMNPSRLVDHASGRVDQGGGNFQSKHSLSGRVRFNKNDTRIKALTLFGSLGLCLEKNSEFSKSESNNKFKNQDNLEKAYQKIVQKNILPAVEKGLEVVVYKQLTDVEKDTTGLFTYDRKKAKVDKRFIRKLNNNIFNA